MAFLLIGLPALAGVLALLLKNDRTRRGLLAATATVHFALTLACWGQPGPAAALDGWLALDAPGRLILTITSALFLAAAFYAVSYLRRESLTPHEDSEERFLFSNQPEAVFTGCLLWFLATMTLVAWSAHVGLLWVAIEATTLASAPLIYFHRHHRSLEAVWKYLLLCSVGIALALVGNFLLAVAAQPAGGGADGGAQAPLLFTRDLVKSAASLSHPWLKASFLFLLVGFGTKMGLAPMHAWLPDAHSEAPSAVSALLSGALLNCAFLGILRGAQICAAAGLAGFMRPPLIVLGLFSMALAACLMIGQADYKRLLAYSSVEHMGLLAVGLGLGGAAVFGAFYHAINHSLVKAGLFLVAGNLMAVYRTKSTARVQGILRVLPASGALWLAGFLAITGAPPFGTFFSELAILRAAVDQGQIAVAVAVIAILALAFIAMAAIFLRMAQGDPAGGWEAPPHFEPWLATLPPMALLLAAFALGFRIPAPLLECLREAARLAVGGPG